ncbi:hypothetical protein GBFDFA_17665 (plasmid) [Edwardsiella anguillarum]|nr:hypothetical protein GBFDFA_17665 [Edwardsiella anguillarum]
MAAIAFSLNKIAIFSYYYLAVNASIAGIAFVSDGSEAMRFKSFQQQFFKHKRINFSQVVNFLWEARQRLYALQHPPRTLLLPFVSPVPY